MEPLAASQANLSCSDHFKVTMTYGIGLVALIPSWDLLLCAKDLFVEATQDANAEGDDRTPVVAGGKPTNNYVGLQISS